jgi:hypothetical protein
MLKFGIFKNIGEKYGHNAKIWMKYGKYGQKSSSFQAFFVLLIVRPP